MRCILVSALVLFAGACGRHDLPRPTTTRTGDAATALAVEEDDAATLDAGPPPSWLDAVKHGAWGEAARLVDAQPVEERNRPEMRYLRARLAAETKDNARVVSELDGLETPLPLLADAIARRRAKAELEVGPYDKAAEYFAARAGSEAQLDASRAYERAGNAGAATTACDKVIAEADRTRRREAEGRARRLRLGLKEVSDQAADARWLAIHAPDLADGHDALDTLAHLDPTHPLTGVELLDRAKMLSEGGKTDEALATIELSGRAPAPRVTGAVRARAKADALNRDRKRAKDAAHAYDACVNASGATDAPDMLLAARALSHADKDDDAIARYAAIVARFPRTATAEQAAYLGARLELLHARWAKAATDFDAYDKAFPNGASKKEAARGRAIAHLMNGDFKKAHAMFERLADADPTSAAADLAAYAALEEGDKPYAITRWSTVANESPSSWRAMLAREHLAALGVAAPAPDPPKPHPVLPPLSPHLLAPADALHGLGLDDEAQSALTLREDVIALGNPARVVELECRTYGLLDVARRRAQIALRIARSTFNGLVDEQDRWAWECSYPEPYAAIVGREEATRDLPAGLIYAVMRQESAFLPTAQSPVHALGLMQLMTETARQTEGDGKLDDDTLFDPATNIHIAAKYLKLLLGRFHGSIPLAVAAYNAGPEAIERWISRSPTEPLDVFVEKIPFAETRGYVIAVMTSYGAYAMLHGQEFPRVSLTLPLPSSTAKGPPH